MGLVVFAVLSVPEFCYGQDGQMMSNVIVAKATNDDWPIMIQIIEVKLAFTYAFVGIVYFLSIEQEFWVTNSLIHGICLKI